MLVFDPNPQAELNLEHGILERLRFKSNARIGAQVLHDAHIDIVEDVIRHDLLVSLETALLADRIDTRYERHPKTWRDHFKVEHPRSVHWWSKFVWNLIVPEYEKYRFTDYATFPYNSYVVPRTPSGTLGKVVYYRQVHLTEE